MPPGAGWRAGSAGVVPRPRGWHCERAGARCCLALAGEPGARASYRDRAGGAVSRVLVVDDEPHLLNAMRITLQARGYEVRTAATGRRALSEATASHPDVVVLDLGLPDLDGVEVITAIRGWS